jgi:hypothetical protein
LHGRYPFTNEPYLDAYLQVITAGRWKVPDELSHFPRRDITCCPGPAPFHTVWHTVSENVASTIAELEIFFSETGYLGLGPIDMLPGDIVCIFLGGTVPFIVRPREGCGYQLIGECYVHGVMFGEAMETISEDNLENFVIW